MYPTGPSKTRVPFYMRLLIKNLSWLEVNTCIGYIHFKHLDHIKNDKKTYISLEYQSIGIIEVIVLQ